MTKGGGNKALTLTFMEQKDYSKNFYNENGFPWNLVQNRNEVEKYWPSAVLSNVEPPTAVPIGPELQIGEPSWAEIGRAHV